ncbi:MAG: Inosine-5'-monophosphate dehydrogenase [Candidatus Pacebacteria bacterium GW2011_GWA1_46_10]|nr:MAG: Inosine-5'-monophosphate dehydrogenase [Candidatus Pacebacteria bacterium GW2011_GWA1_46_10]HCR81295.1 IMP dehydrogenase [Candidatus Paceibacterota bacterium]
MPTQSNIPLALAYDDVLLVPQRSRIKHRADTNTATYLTSKIKLALPFLSANMDTVTESQMAIAMARAGGLGVIHRFMTIKDQVKEVDKVARFEGFFIDNPYTTHPDKPVRHIIENIALNGVSSYLVVDQKNKLLGLVSRRDVIFETDHSQKVSQVMTPLKSLITVPPGTTKDKAKKLFAKYKIEKLPVIKRDGTLAGLITAKSIENYELQPLATKDELGRLRCGAAVGVVGDYLERAGALLTAGADVLVVDVAHGQNAASLEAIAALRKTYHQAQIIGGNVATPQGVKDLIKAGVDAVKVGIGPGGICSTRMVTGVGVPQFTAVMQCTAAAKGTKVKVIADGGTNYAGDIAKALAAGASTIMLAGWFAGTNESPGEIIVRNNRKFKVHRGSASFSSQVDRGARTGTLKNGLNTIVPEGVESLIEYKGGVSDIIYQLLGSLRSAMSYCNATTIKELQQNAKFVRITSAGFRESKTHNVDEI